MSRERGSSLHHRISELVDKRKVGLDPKEAFVNHVWPEVENDYQGMADELAKLCKEELSIRKVPAAVESRIKSRDSIAKSLERREIYRQARSEEPYKDIREILLDLHDLVGIRIIVDYIDQIKTATDFITGTFHKEKDPNVFSANRKAGRSWTSWFGAYECTNHHVSAKYAESSNLSCYNGVIFEIQVTSLPANLYNRIAHPLLYKGEAGELSQGDEIVIDLTRGLAFCYSLCTYYKRYKLNEEKCIGDDEMELLRNASSTTEGPVFMSSISDLAGRIPGVDTAKIKGKSIPRERLEMVLESLLNKEIQSDIGRYVADQLKQEIKDIGRPRIELHAFGRARFDSQDVFQSPVCQEGTQIGARQYIHDWVKNGKERLLWICSHAGTGKSTLARTIARKLTETGQIAAGYFFKRGDVGRNHLRHVIPTIAAQLIMTIPQYEYYLRESIDACKNTDFENMLIYEQFKVLLKTPLSQVGASQSTKVIIIDALDECVDLIQLHQVMDLLTGLKNLVSIQFRLLVTSRDEAPVRAAIVRHCHDKLLLATVYHDDNISDIQSILRVGFGRIRKNRTIEPTWPTKEQFREIVHHSTNPTPLFIYATTLLRFLGDGTCLGFPKRRLESWMKKPLGPTFTTQLDKMYTTVLMNLDPDLGPGSSEVLTGDEKASLRMILGAISLAAEPLSINSLVEILGLDLDVLELVKSCRAVLYVPDNNDEPLQILHKSFSDFLLEGSQSRKYWFNVDELEQHLSFADGCIKHLEGKLRRNICELQDPAVSQSKIEPRTVKKYISKSVQYASTYWVQHLRKAGDTELLSGVAGPFLFKLFLEWIECMAILGRLDRASSAIQELRAINRLNNYLGRFLYDAYRFLLKHGSIIQESPRQTYGSALLFSPKNSIIRNTFWDRRLHGCYNVRNMPQEWDSVLRRMPLKPLGISIHGIALSPDGTRLASSHTNYNELPLYPRYYIELWQAVTGAHLATASILSTATAMCWTEDGKNLMFVAEDGHVYVHDFLEEHPTVVSLRPFKISPPILAAISPTGVVAMAQSTDPKMPIPHYSRRCRLTLWDSIKGKALHVWKSMARVGSIAISHDSCQFAVTSYGTIKLLSAKADSVSDLAAISMFTILAFSSDNDRLFALSGGSLRIFSIEGGPSRTVDVPLHHASSSMSVFPDERTFATYDDQLLLWTIGHDDIQQHGKTTPKGRSASPDLIPELPMEIGHVSSVNLINMSPDGQYLVSASSDRLCLWRLPESTLYKLLVPTEARRLSSLVPYPGQLCSTVKFSRDGRWLLAVYSCVIYVWAVGQRDSLDVELVPTTSIPISSLHNLPVVDTIWMNGTRVAINLEYRVEIWDIEDGGRRLHTFVTPPDNSLAYGLRPDLLAISYGSTVNILPQCKGASQKEVTMPFPIGRLSFSPDGSMLLISDLYSENMWTAVVQDGTHSAFHNQDLISSPVKHLPLRDDDIPSDSYFFYADDPVSGIGRARAHSFSTDGKYVKARSGRIAWYNIQHARHASPVSQSLSMVGEMHAFEEQSWIRRGTQRTIQIPQGSYSSCIGYGGKHVALIDRRSKIIIVELD